MTDLNKIKLGHSPLTDTIFLYRHGKDTEVALDKREALADVMGVLVTYMMHDAERGCEHVVRFGDKRYKVRVEPVAEDEA